MEIGCGPGFDVHWFARNFPDSNFTAVDISAEMVKLTQSRLDKDKLSNAKVFQSDERSLTNRFSSQSFDLIYVYFGALNTVDDLSFAAKQLHALLRIDGVAVLTFVNKWYMRELIVQSLKLNFKLAFARLGKVWGGYSVERHLDSHCYTPSFIRRVFSDFKELEHKGYSIFYPPWYNDHKVRENPEKAERKWNCDQRIQRTPLWSTGEYSLFVFQKNQSQTPANS